jgi:CMP-N-acetylneuraminic acid synthetase
VDGESGAMDYYDPRGGETIARQQLTPVYHRNGVAYAITRSCLLDQQQIKGARTGALVIDEPMMSIDTLWDLELAEYLLSRRDDS